MQIKYNVLDPCELGRNQTKSLGKLLPGPDSFVKGNKRQENASNTRYFWLREN